MTPSALTMLVILIVMFGFLLWERFPAWLVFMGALTATMTLKLAPAEALLKGFSNSGVITVAALYPVAAGMYATGAISLLSQRLIGQPKSELSAQMKMLPPVGLASAFMNNTPLVAMMIPVVRDLTRTTGLSGRGVYMSLSFAAILGGTMTLIGTSSNLIVAGLYGEALASGQLEGADALGIFTPFWVGLAGTAAGLAFLIFVAPRLLAKHGEKSEAPEVARMYRSELKVEPRSVLEGKTLREAGFEAPSGYRLEAVLRGGKALETGPGVRLAGGDELVFSAQSRALPALWTTLGLVPIYATSMKTERHRHRLVELVLSANSPAVGRRIGELGGAESAFHLMIVGVSRNGKAPEEPLKDLRMEAGDAAIVEVDDAFFYENRRESDFILTKRLEGYHVQRIDRAITAGGITGVMVALAALGIMSMLNAALLATGAMMLTGCLTVNRAWRSLEWQTLVVLGAALGLAAGVTGSGLSQALAELFASIGGRSPYAALAATYLGAVVLTNLINYAAAAAFMFPVAISLAAHVGADFMPFAVVLMNGAAACFINPASYQTNLMVQGPGNYSFADFAKVGAPLTVLVGAVVLVMTPLLFKF